MVTEIVTAIGDSMVGFVQYITGSMVNAFSGLFWVPAVTGASPVPAHLTLLAEGLLTLAGIGLVIGCVVKIYHIFSGRIRKSM